MTISKKKQNSQQQQQQDPAAAAATMKGKQLLRSHAMRETTSPPHTPTPRAEANGNANRSSSSSSSLTSNGPVAANQVGYDGSTAAVSGTAGVNESIANNNNCSSSSSKSGQAQALSGGAASSMNAAGTSGSGSGESMSAGSVLLISQHNKPPPSAQQNVAPLSNETEFPKLTPPKSNKNSASAAAQQTRNGTEAGGSSKPGGSTAGTGYKNSAMNYQLHAGADGSVPHEKENRCPRSESRESFDRPSGSVGSTANSNTLNKKHRLNSNPNTNSNAAANSSSGNNNISGSSNTKGTKPRLKHYANSSNGADNPTSSNGGAGVGSGSGQSSSNNNNNSSGSNTSGFISRVSSYHSGAENSSDQYTDHGGTDLLSFFTETLNKNPKDRYTLMRIEKDLTELVTNKSRSEYRFPPSSSYNRMLIHRAAAYFGLDHNVDTDTQQCVIVTVTKSTRLPEIRFRSLCRDQEMRKGLLKRDAYSFEDGRQSTYLCPERGMLDRKVKSFDVHEEEFERGRSRVFQRTPNDSEGPDSSPVGEHQSWASMAAAEDQQQQQQSQQQSQPPPQHHQQQQPRPQRLNNKPLKMHNNGSGGNGASSGSSSGAVPKTHNTYGGSYNTTSQTPAGSGSQQRNNRNFSKQDSSSSSNSQWRRSPSSNGSKTRTQSVRSDSVTPSPTTGYGSDDQASESAADVTLAAEAAAAALALAEVAVSCDDAVERRTTAFEELLSAMAPCGLLWAVTELSSVPIGSVLINPHTLQPIRNQDGSIYQFDPSNLPASQVLPGSNSNNNSSNASSSYQQSSKTNSTLNKALPQYAQQQQQQQQSPATAVTSSAQTQQQQQQSPPQQQQQAALPQPKVSESIATTPGIVTSSSAAEAGCNESCSSAVTQEAVQVESTYNAYVPPPPTRDSACSSAEPPSASQETNQMSSVSSSSSCLSITTTAARNYDRIEISKYKNQATSPNIPSSEKEISVEPTPSAVDDVEQASQAHSPVQLVAQGGSHLQHQNCETPLTASSTPFSNSEPSPNTNVKLPSEEPKAMTGYTTYTHTFQSADGSTVYQTSAAPAAPAPAPYCTAYQQAPDGSIYALPSNMMYAYPQPNSDGELQSGYLMPIFDPNHQRPESGSVVAAAPQPLYHPASGTTAVLPVPTAAPYPAPAPPQFAPGNGASHIFPGQIIYTNGEAYAIGAPPQSLPAAPPPPANGGQLQPITMASYPIGYQYAPYNGYWGQPMTYCVPQSQLINAAAAAAPLQQSAPMPPPPSVVPQTPHHPQQQLALMQAPQPVAQHIVNIAAGPAVGQAQANSVHSANGNGGSNAYPMTSGGTTYYTATPRISKRGGPGGGSTHYHANNGFQSANAVGTNNAGYMVQAQQQPGHHLTTVTLSGGQSSSAGATTTYHNTDLSAGTPNNSAQLYSAHYPPNGIPYAVTAVSSPATAQQNASTAAAAGSLNSVMNAPPFYPATALSTNGPPTPAPAPAPQMVDGTAMKPSTPHNAHMPVQHQMQSTGRQATAYVTTPQNVIVAAGAASGSGGHANANNGNYQSNASTPHYYHAGAEHANNASSYANSSYDRRNNGNARPRSHGSSGYSASRQYNGTNNNSNGNSGRRTPLLNSNNESTPRASPGSSNNQNGGNSYYHQTNRVYHTTSARRDKPVQTPLLSIPPTTQATPLVSAQSGGESKPPIRLNAGAATFRQRSTGGTSSSNGMEFRRSSTSQRSTPPSTNGTNSHGSSNNSPNTATLTAAQGGAYTILEQQPQPQQPTGAPSSVYLTRSAANIPPHQLQHAGGAVAAGAPQQQPATVVAAATAIGGYNPAAGPHGGVYFKYGQTYIAHHSVAVSTSRRSPSNDMRPPPPQMAQVAAAGMYPATAMMIQGPPPHPRHHAPGGRHMNPNYRGTRPR